MRWFVCAIALLMLSACDDDGTGPGTASVAEWVKVTAPAEVGRGSVVRLATGGGRVVGLVHTETGEWVIEESPTGWTTVLGKPLPFLPPEFATARAIRFDRGSLDLVVSDEGRIYVVGATVAPGPYGDAARTPAIWAEADTGWVLTPGPKDAGILLAAEWHAGVGIEAVGIGNVVATLLTMRGTPETGLGWSSIVTPYPGLEAYINDMALEGGTVYAGGSLYGEVSPGGSMFRGLFLQGSGGAIAPLESPCGECVGLAIGAVESRDGGTYWGGLLREDVPLGAPVEVVGWLASYDHGSQTWAEIELAPEIKRVNDILNFHGTLFLAVETETGSGIYRSQGRGFVSELVPEGGVVYLVEQTSDQRVIGAGTWAVFPELGELLLVERE